MKVAFVTFGCRLNRAESLDLEARYQAAGHEIVDLGMTSRETGGTHPVANNIPDLILVRGCSVTAKAQRATPNHHQLPTSCQLPTPSLYRPHAHI